MKNTVWLILAAVVLVICFGSISVWTQVVRGNCKINFKPGTYSGVYFVNGNRHQGENTVRLQSNGSYRLGIIANELPNGGINFAVSAKCKVTSVSNPDAVYSDGKTIYFKSVPNLGGGLTGWWRGERDARDSSGNGRDGREVGRPSYNAGKAGQAFNFNNVSPSRQGIYLQNPSGGVMPQNNGTVTLWLNWSFKTAGQNEVIFGGCLVLNPGQPCLSRTPIVGIIGDYSLGWWFGSRKHTTQSTANDFDRCYGMYPLAVGQWRHAAITYKKRADASFYDINFYVDGRKIGDQCGGLFIMGHDIPQEFHIGLGRQETGSGFNGLVDEVRTYNRVLSENEIEAIFKYER